MSNRPLSTYQIVSLTKVIRMNSHVRSALAIAKRRASENYYQLVEFHRLYRHTKVKQGPGLGIWVKNQRGKNRPGVGTDHWIRLNLLGFWDN